MKIPFTQVDAFADKPFTGNPAAVMTLNAWLPDNVLQAIAAENNLAETAFLIPSGGDDADYDLRWFTPTVEVALCGHATLASGYALLAANPEDHSVRFATRKAGVLEVSRDGQSYLLALPAWTVEPKPLPDIAAAMGGNVIETHWRDGGYAILLYQSADDIRALNPDFRALGRFGDILYIATAPGEDTDIISRVFAPGAGIDEDPVTGSAHCLLTTFWSARLGRKRFSAFQASARGGYIGCELMGDKALLSGSCVTIIEGSFTLP